MALDNSIAHSQPQAYALLLSLSGEEGREQFAHILLGNATTCVLNLYLELIISSS